MLPRSSLCCASHGAAQFYMLPRPMLPRYVLRAAAPRSLVPRSLRAAALHGAARGTTHRVFALLPRGGLDCYKRAARSTVGVSCSTAVVEVGRLRIDVEVSRSTTAVEVGRRWIDVEVSRPSTVVKIGSSQSLFSRREESFYGRGGVQS